MHKTLITKILSLFNLQFKKILPSSSGYRNQSIPILLKNNILLNLLIYKSEPEIIHKIKNANKISNFLYQKGFPTRKSIFKNGKDIIKLKNQNTTRYISLYNYLPGNTIPWEAYTSLHIKLLGGMMGKMHQTLKYLNKKDITTLPDAHIELLNICEEMEKYFNSENVTSALAKKLKIKTNIDFAKYKNLISKKTNQHEKQTVHLDFVRGNILFNDKKSKDSLYISGIIDFEKVAFGSRILDIARTLAFLIIDCKYKEEEKVRKYFLYNGYQKRGENILPNLTNLDDFINFYIIHDLYKFLLYNPYEFLHENEHFLRTSEFLQKRYILTKIQ